MNTIWKLFKGDVRRMTSNIISIIIMIGLVVIPAIFTWFNVTASWDPFGNTRNLKFAVASVDKGYKSDLMPIKTDIGDQVINRLRANSKLDWTFTTKDKAIEGTKSGEYYAAVIIPEDFSRDMMTFFSPDSRHATLEYYTNEKKNAVAPKVTGAGADQIATQVNKTFASTISATALSVASGLSDHLDDPASRARLSTFAGNIDNLANQLGEQSNTLGTYSALVTASQSLLTSSSALLGGTAKSASDSAKDIDTAGKGVSDVSEALGATVATLSTALKQSAASYGSVGDTIDGAFASAGKSSADVSKTMRDEASTVGQQVANYQQIYDRLNAVNASGQLNDALAQLQAIIQQQKALQATLNVAAAQLDSGTAAAEGQRQEAKQLADQTKKSIQGLNSNLDATLKPQINALTSSLTEATNSLKSGASNLNTAIGGIDGAADGMGTKLDDTRKQLAQSQDLLNRSSKRLRNFSKELSSALNSGDMAQVKRLLAGDPGELSEVLATPVKLKRTAVFPVENFGTALTPFYTFIPLWVGSVLIALTVKTEVSDRVRRQLGEASRGWGWDRAGDGGRGRARPLRRGAAVGEAQDDTRKATPIAEAGRITVNPGTNTLYLGRFGIFALISLMQSTFSCAGTLLFLRVHAVHPMLFMLAGWLSGLTYAFVVYTLVACFGTVGKAIAVIVLVMQISGSSGSYPLQVLPRFVSAVNPFLPAAHSIQAARAAIAGIYQGDYWMQMGIVLIYAAIALAVGLIVHKPSRFSRWFSQQLERTKVL
ncbi:putative membrane protein [Bifidobacterium bohemicum]|uniref:Phage infection protein n=1 Tax=Bifidobacterium bohemicum DSM 22767 TaxID=1437606 RepID=A0A086ZHD9_9BIFI|nr:YhgE/Pip domain-containing protein [Bifidobacterium bohemicum]KFI45939.1 phage infection protein [Bifidobacterium bohemicum DSM 22767]SCC14596.1 putative membrane protein [Bifidobacterium bohemicum]